jgi:hypothetical protein
LTLEADFNALEKFFLNAITKPARPKVDLGADVSRLGNHGYRDLVEHLSQFYWGHHNMVITERWFNQYSPGMIAYINRMKCQYTQGERGIPNLFLARNDAGIENEIGATLPQEYFKAHRSTHWLKYLITHYVFLKEGTARVSDVLRVFSGSEELPSGKSNLDGYYERHLVRICLGSLSEARASHVLEPDYEIGRSITDPIITLTMRGRFLMETYAKSFTYMQLVCTDYLLKLPKRLMDFYKNDADYLYLAAPPEEYGPKSEAMIRYKAKLVAVFLEMLDVALASEMERCNAVEQNLKEEGVELPSVSDWKSRLSADLRQLSSVIGGNDAVDILDTEARKFASDLRDELEFFFQRAYLIDDI